MGEKLNSRIIGSHTSFGNPTVVQYINCTGNNTHLVSYAVSGDMATIYGRIRIGSFTRKSGNPGIKYRFPFKSERSWSLHTGRATSSGS